MPFLILGAFYDANVATLAAGLLREAGITCEVWIDRPPLEVAWALKNSRFHLGFQSGLGILADNFGTPQLMMYFKHLAKLQFAWCQPGHARLVFHAGSFAQSPKDVLEGLQEAYACVSRT